MGPRPESWAISTLSKIAVAVKPILSRKEASNRAEKPQGKAQGAGNEWGPAASRNARRGGAALASPLSAVIVGARLPPPPGSSRASTRWRMSSTTTAVAWSLGRMVGLSARPKPEVVHLTSSTRAVASATLSQPQGLSAKRRPVLVPRTPTKRSPSTLKL